MRRGLSGKQSIGLGLLLAMLVPLTGCCQQQKKILQQRNDTLMQEVRNLEDRLNYSEYELLNVKEQYDLLRRAALGGESETSTSRPPSFSNPGSGGDFPTDAIPPLLIEPIGPLTDMPAMPVPDGASHTFGSPQTFASTPVSPLESEWPSEPSPPTNFLSIDQVSARSMEIESQAAIPVSFEEYADEAYEPSLMSGQGWRSAE